MIIERIPAGIYATNCYVLTCEDTKKTAIVDPAGDADEILEYIKKNNLEATFMILTHAHGDHIGAVSEIIEHGVTGYVIQNGNREGFKKDILKILSDEEHSKRMGKIGRERIFDLFGMDRKVGDFLLMIEKDLKAIKSKAQE